jgi:hypothetical protein
MDKAAKLLLAAIALGLLCCQSADDCSGPRQCPTSVSRITGTQPCDPTGLIWMLRARPVVGMVTHDAAVATRGSSVTFRPDRRHYYGHVNVEVH